MWAGAVSLNNAEGRVDFVAGGSTQRVTSTMHVEQGRVDVVAGGTTQRVTSTLRVERFA